MRDVYLPLHKRVKETERGTYADCLISRPRHRCCVCRSRSGSTLLVSTLWSAHTREYHKEWARKKKGEKCRGSDHDCGWVLPCGGWVQCTVAGVSAQLRLQHIGCVSSHRQHTTTPKRAPPCAFLKRQRNCVGVCDVHAARVICT
jgi:hypothetical protein